MIPLADRVKGIGCRGARRVRSSWLSASGGRRVEVGAMLSWAGCWNEEAQGMGFHRGHSGEISLCMCHLLDLTGARVFVRDGLLAGKFHEDGNRGVCDVLAAFLYGILLRR